MLITSLLPLLSRHSLGCDLVAGPDGTVTLTIIPRKAAGAAHALDGEEARPISITGTAAELDAELARGGEGALGQLITARKALADQIAEQRDAAEQAKAAAAAKPKPAGKTSAKAATKSADAEKAAAPAGPAASPPAAPATSAPGDPASLW